MDTKGEAHNMQPEEEFKQFRENTNIYKQMFQFSPFSIIIHDMEMNIVEVNQKTIEQFGYSEKELLAMKVPDLHTEEELENSNRVLQSMQTKDKMHVETSFKRKDGTVFFAEATPFKYKLGEKPLIHVYIQDVSERRDDEMRVVKAMEKAEESDRLKSAFLANMSHEIRTPMNGILGFIRMLKKPYLKNSEKEEFINIIEKSGNRMLHIINDIMNVSKLEAGLVKLDTRKLNINEQIEFLYTFFRPEAQKKGVKLLSNRPLSSSEAIIESDEEKLIAILTNLLKNALKYTHRGTVEFGYGLKGNQLEFYVKDTGIGIPEERTDAIFNRFTQADLSDKEARQGAGLGLTISKAYAEMLGGEIRVESQEGKGSSFYVTIPYRKGKKQTAGMELVTPHEITASHLLENPNGLKILIAEDDEFSFSLLKLMLENISTEILHVKTGAEAVEIVADNPDIDLILMDIKMPGMSGYEATQKIRKFNKEVVIVAQTAFALMGDDEKALRSGCNAYLTKPVSEEDLQTIIKRYFLN